MKNRLHFTHKNCNKKLIEKPHSICVCIKDWLKKRVVKLFMSLEQRKRNLANVMENSLRPPKPHLNKRLLSRSCSTLEMEDPRTLGENPRKTFGKKRSKFVSNLQNHTRIDTRNDDCSLEILYKTTDIVLIICAVVFIISSITSVILWLYGCPWVDLVKNEIHFKP